MRAAQQSLRDAERRFPVRIRIGVPPEGLGSRLDQIFAWLDANCGADGRNAAKVRGFSLTASGFTAETDSLLEEAGFELSVPPAGAGLFATSGMEKPEFANDVVGSYRAGLAASLRRLVAPPTVEQMGDRTFELGDVGKDDYTSLILSDKLVGLVGGSLAQCSPECASCAFEPHCGSDPVYHHATQADPVGIKPLSEFCARQKAVLRLLIELLEDFPEDAAVLRGWIAQ